MREALVTIGDADFEELGIDQLVSLYEEAGIQEFEELACHGDSSVVRAEVEERVDEDRLDALEYVEEWDHIVTPNETHLYLVGFYAPNLSEEIAEEVTELVGTCEPEITEHGASMRLVGPQEAISGTLTVYEREGVSPDLRRLGEYDGRSSPVDELTDRQREVIQKAFRMGYYEVPRKVSTAEIAEEFNVDPSTVAEHLQRAERNLLAQHFSAE